MMRRLGTAFGRAGFVFLAGVLALVALTSCGGAGSADPFMEASLSKSRRHALAEPSTVPSDVDPLDAARQLFEFAELKYPQYFPAVTESGYYAPYLYRYYASTGVYLGVARADVYVMGGPFGDVPVLVGPITRFMTPTNPNATSNQVKGRLLLAAKSRVQVFWDCNGNWQLDAGELNSDSGDDGSYTIDRRPGDACQLRARTSAASSDAGSTGTNSPYTMSALPGQTAKISPLTSLVAAAGVTVEAVEAALSLPVGSVDVPEVLAATDLSAARRMAIAVADQLQQRDLQIRSGDLETAGLEIMRHSKQLLSARSERALNGARQFEPMVRPSIDLSGAQYFDTSGLPVPAAWQSSGLQKLLPDGQTNLWAIRPDASLTSSQISLLTDVVNRLNTEKVPGSSSAHIPWTNLQANVLLDLSTRATSAVSPFSRDVDFARRVAGWVAYRESVNSEANARIEQENFRAFVWPREGSAKFVFDIAANAFKAGINAAELATGVSVDAQDLFSSVRDSAAAKQDFARLISLMYELKLLKQLVGGAECAVGLGSFYDPSNSGTKIGMDAMVAAINCLKLLTTSENLRIVGILISDGGDAAIKGRAYLRGIKSGLDIASLYVKGRPGAFLEFAATAVDSYIKGAEYADQSGRLADEKAIEIESWLRGELARIDRAFYVSNLRVQFTPRVYFKFEQPLFLPTTWSAPAAGSDTRILFSFGLLTPSVAVPAADQRLQVQFGDGTSQEVFSNREITHTYPRAGEFQAEVSVRSNGKVYRQAYVVKVAELGLAAANQPPFIVSAGADSVREGEPIHVVLAVQDPESDALSIKVKVGRSFGASECIINVGLASTGVHSLSGCADLTRVAGQELFFSAEATDSRMATAEPRRWSQVVRAAQAPDPTTTNQPPTVRIGGMLQAGDGSVSIDVVATDPEGQQMTLVAYLSHAGDAGVNPQSRTTPLLTASGAGRRLSWPGATLSALLKAGQLFTVWVEARDDKGAIGQAISDQVTRAGDADAAGTPLTVAGLVISQNAPGQPVAGSFAVNGSTVSMVRVHAGTTSDMPSCYQDLPLGAGAKTFSFNGTWTRENGLSCSALIPDSGSVGIVFKLEVRDAAGKLANGGVPPLMTVSWAAANLSSAVVLNEAGGWNLAMRLSAVPKAGGVGRFSFGQFGCGGTLRYAGVLSATGEHVFQEDHEYGTCAKDCALHVSQDLRGYREICPSTSFSDVTTHTGSFSAHGLTAGQMVAAAQSAEGATRFGLVEALVNDAWQYPPVSGADFKAGVPALALGRWAVGLRMGVTDFDGVRLHFSLPTECKALEIAFVTRDPGSFIYFRDMTMTTSSTYSSTPVSMPAGHYMLALRRLSSATMGWTLHDRARSLLLESGTVPSGGLAQDVLNGEIRLQGYRGSCAIQRVRVTDWLDATWF